MKEHKYSVTSRWTGNLGEGTASYRSYKREHTINVENKAPILGSSMPQYLGDAKLHNPEELLLGAISACHMLWYLHLCSAASVVVSAYEDQATGMMIEAEDGSGRFTSVTLKPVVTVANASMVETANKLHKEANRFCFIAQSVNFPVSHQPLCRAVSNK